MNITPSWSPDGRSIAYTSPIGSDILISNISPALGEPAKAVGQNLPVFSRRQKIVMSNRYGNNGFT
jgi:Tol biopolymer transport system component